MMWGYHDGSGWWMAIGVAGMALFWLVILAAFYYLGRSLNRRDGLTATEIARRRFADGEIGEVDYERIVARLSGGGGAARQ